LFHFSVEKPGIRIEKISAASSQLTFENPSKSHSGLYQCQATNLGAHPAETIRSTVKVKIVNQPIIVLAPEDQTVEEGQQAMFNCSERSGKVEVKARTFLVIRFFL